MSGDKFESDGFEIHEFHRDEILDEDGISQVVLERFLNHRLPFLLQVKEEMDEGRAAGLTCRDCVVWCLKGISYPYKGKTNPVLRKQFGGQEFHLFVKRHRASEFIQ